MNDGSENLKAYFAPLARAMADFSEGPVRAAMDALFEEDAILRICHPFGELVGPNAFYKTAYAPLLKAMPDLERRELILLAGKTPGTRLDWYNGQLHGDVFGSISGHPAVRSLGAYALSRVLSHQ